MKKITKNIDLLNSTTMKTLRLFGMTLMMVLVASCFTACGGDDDDESSTDINQIEGGGGNYNDLIIGRWLLIDVSDSEGKPLSYWTEDDDGDGFEFDSGGTFTYYYDGYRLSNGKSWAEIWVDKKDRLIGTYTVKGNNLTLYNDGKSIVNTIVNMTKDRLKLKNPNGYTTVYDRFSY